ncbi:uncharacterized protein PFL1_06600 [Pseudozyma flocculosa PF-1]|uniref:DUF6604 domain-containing protein n=2 Tax=Pseudozyma flocculosa TaxID=84751 RepID=A0A5C3F7Z5_9BASI|nr:uncharacterized protein PFL1_06600 [Pseudozyma flocculosa PF-1]EPQ25926.1 hypothetical protein PFL1_06600 [Pseudozyma flocculosa PF-1]SPO40573.1 uncharacterized protein PSFLO_06055 [Pseudozyma flocculosa]
MDGYSSTYWAYKRDTDLCASWLATTALSLGFPKHRIATAVKPKGAGAGAGARAPANATQRDLHSSASTHRGTGSEHGNGIGQGACHHGSSGPAPAPAPAQYKYILRIPQFIELAQFIADQGASVAPDKLRLIRRCIHRRLTCIHFFGEQPDLSRLQHVFFVEVLIEVCTILEPFEAEEVQVATDDLQRPSTAKAAAAATATTASTASSSSPRSPQSAGSKKKNKGKGQKKRKGKGPARPAGNLFTQLETYTVDEGDDDDDHADDSPGEEALQYQVEDNVDEALCAFMALYTDLHEIRRFLRQLWSDYRQRKTDLVTASLTTNTAFQLVEKAHADIMSRYSSLFDAPEDILFSLVDYAFELRTGQRLCVSRNGRRSQILAGSLRIKAARDALLFAFEHFLLFPLDWLPRRRDLWRESMDAVDPNNRATTTPILLGFDYATLTPEQRLLQDRRLVDEAFADFAMFDSAFQHAIELYTRFVPPSGCQRADSSAQSADALTREMSRFIRGDDAPSLLLLFEIQVYLDINYTLQGDNVRGWLDSKRELHRIQRSLEDASWLEYPYDDDDHAGFRIRVTLQGVDDLLSEMYARSGSPPMAGAPRPGKKKQQKRGRMAHFLERHPTYCGLQAFRGLLLHQTVGFEVANFTSLILASAHLYVACRNHVARQRTEHAALRWPDMDMVVGMHGPEAIFGGMVPATMLDSCQAAMTTYGYEKSSVLDYLHGSHLRRKKATRELNKTAILTRLERLQDDSPFVSIFASLQCTCTNHKGALLQADFNDGTVQRLLADTKARQVRAAFKAEGKKPPPRVKPSSPPLPSASASSSSSSAVVGASQHRQQQQQQQQQQQHEPEPSMSELLGILSEGLRADMRALQFDYVALHTRCARAFEEVCELLDRSQWSSWNGTTFETADELGPMLLVCFVLVSCLQDCTGKRCYCAEHGRAAAESSNQLLVDIADVIRKTLGLSGADSESRRLAKAVSATGTSSNPTSTAGTAAKSKGSGKGDTMPSSTKDPATLYGKAMAASKPAAAFLPSFTLTQV